MLLYAQACYIDVTVPLLRHTLLQCDNTKQHTAAHTATQSFTSCLHDGVFSALLGSGHPKLSIGAWSCWSPSVPSAVLTAVLPVRWPSCCWWPRPQTTHDHAGKLGCLQGHITTRAAGRQHQCQTAIAYWHQTL